MPEELSTHVGLAVLALLCYRLLFCSTRELSLTTLLFCAACSSVLFSAAVREACWNYTAYFAQDESAP